MANFRIEAGENTNAKQVGWRITEGEDKAYESGFAPMTILIGMMLTMIVLGSFLDELALLMISIPVYMPVVQALAFDPVWFGLMMLLTLEIATISPPYGLALLSSRAWCPMRAWATCGRRASPICVFR